MIGLILFFFLSFLRYLLFFFPPLRPLFSSYPSFLSFLLVFFCLFWKAGSGKTKIYCVAHHAGKLRNTQEPEFFFFFFSIGKEKLCCFNHECTYYCAMKLSVLHWKRGHGMSLVLGVWHLGVYI
ncbi:hypothetical protein P167DRAFT_305012 [Morchella conica CCBAS932]|uniref:Uncharacterized protein n=1 Tax=Morchella conica CCBAS932 TaxID=1392247 RepID=A0A3N4KG43_9PEZI|nr:hypothetical protein P167DRAFT_305012 [Morchella conica CCBAS932]